MYKILASLAIVTFLAACASTNQVKVSTTPVAIPEFKVPQPRKPNISNVKFRVVTADNIDSFAEDFKKRGGTIYVLDGSNMKVLTGNISELKRYVAQQKTVILTLQAEHNRLSQQQNDLINKK